jgi:serine/threonine-protein kinase
MAPEQFARDRSKIDARTDVFALGSILYEMTTLKPAFELAHIEEMARASTTDKLPELKIVPPSTHMPGRARTELDEICMTALAADPEKRYPSARAIGRALEDFFEGTKEKERRRRHAEKQAEVGEGLARGYFDLLDSRSERVAELEALQASVLPHESIERKRELWNAEDRVAVTDRIAIRTLQGAISAFESAIEAVPEHARARKGLAELYAREVERAKARRNDFDRAYFEALLRQQRGSSGPESTDVVTAVRIATSPRPATVVVHRYQVVDRRLVLGKPIASGTAPLDCGKLAEGSYLACGGLGGGRIVRHPFLVQARGEIAITLDLAAIEKTSADEAYVPGGAALLTLGGSELREVDVPGFYISVLPVSFSDYLEFLADIARGDASLVEDHVPCNGDGEPYWEWSGGEFVRVGTGMLGAARSEVMTWPVFGIAAKSAEMYAAWKSAKSGLDYRLPNEAEWEKAGRGIDGRNYPWGDTFDATFCKMRESRAAQPRPERRGVFTADESPYGVRDMAGGIADWTAGVDGTRAIAKGGAWCDWAPDCNLGARRIYALNERAARVGFRLARKG